MSEAKEIVDDFAKISGLYERPDTDGGFISDQGEIMQLKAIRKSDIINSELLGEFDENGTYSMDKNLVIELVRLPKLLTKQNDYGTFATARIDDKEFHFRQTPTRIEDGKLVSDLELLEEIYHANGYIIDTRTTLLATYTYNQVPNFDELARMVFHISTHPADDDFGGDVGDGNGVLRPDEAEYIKHRLAYLKAMGLVSLGLYERLEEAYFNKRIKILNSIPEAAVVLAEYKKQFAKVEHFFVRNSKRKYRAMNEILTAVIEGGKGEKLRKNAQYRAQMREANKIYLKTVLQIDESVKQSMDVINAVAQNMPLTEAEEIKKANIKVAVTKEEQNQKGKTAAKSASKGKSAKRGGAKPTKLSPNNTSVAKRGGGKKAPATPIPDAPRQTVQPQPTMTMPKSTHTARRVAPQPAPQNNEDRNPMPMPPEQSLVGETIRRQAPAITHESNVRSDDSVATETMGMSR